MLAVQTVAGGPVDVDHGREILIDGRSRARRPVLTIGQRRHPAGDGLHAGRQWPATFPMAPGGEALPGGRIGFPRSRRARLSPIAFGGRVTAGDNSRDLLAGCSDFMAYVP